MNCVHVVTGPTGAGKSDVAARIAEEHGAPIVVADRIQCYLDLPVTSARLDGCPHRHHLAARTVPDGDYPVHEAAYALLRKVEALSRTHEHVVVEGGSISLLRRFADCRGRFPFRLTATVLPLGDEHAHLDRLRVRAARMIADGMLDEIAKAWQHHEQRAFVASVNGPEAVLRWCTEHRVEPEELPGVDDAGIAELTELVALVHLEHSLEQHDVFSRLFGWNHE
ncbi:isopentenyl transferase family protein [Lentzea nigeriaca]|uniref:isopentenyl transferase family protein n=1 Tax=Lentzea nigeriaca TaxID=1128665 RepID=UPI0019597DC5|nr:isopentenyl transferase family protein [Lentzea nigeriaca]MBM7856982.1 tRNA A37 N6-isopentenylltransferase MiaA [Lentzea nigeriaca]